SGGAAWPFRMSFLRSAHRCWGSNASFREIPSSTWKAYTDRTGANLTQTSHTIGEPGSTTRSGRRPFRWLQVPEGRVLPRRSAESLMSPQPAQGPTAGGPAVGACRRGTDAALCTLRAVAYRWRRHGTSCLLFPDNGFLPHGDGYEKSFNPSHGHGIGPGCLWWRGPVRHRGPAPSLTGGRFFPPVHLGRAAAGSRSVVPVCTRKRAPVYEEQR